MGGCWPAHSWSEPCKTSNTNRARAVSLWLHLYPVRALNLYHDLLDRTRRLGERTSECFQLYLLSTGLAYANRINEALAWAEEQHPAEPGRTPSGSLRLCTIVTEIYTAGGRTPEAKRWAHWTRRWLQSQRRHVQQLRQAAELTVARAEAL